MLTLLKTFNKPLPGTRAGGRVDVSSKNKSNKSSSTLGVPLPPYCKNSRVGRMIETADAFKRPAMNTTLQTILRYHPFPAMHTRSVHTSTPAQGLSHGAWSLTPKAVGAAKNTKYEYFQFSTWILAAALPVGMIFSPSFLNMPLDILVGFAVPFHAWYGVHHVLEDYVPSAFLPASNVLLYLITAIAVLGLLNLNLRGDGIIENIKSLWRDEEEKRKKKQQ